jgi:hypothetical protein
MSSKETESSDYSDFSADHGGIIDASNIVGTRTRPKIHRMEYAPAATPLTRPEAVHPVQKNTAGEDNTTQGGFRIGDRHHSNGDEKNGDLVQLAEHFLLESEDDFKKANIFSVENDDGEGGWNEERSTMDMLLQLQRRSHRNMRISSTSESKPEPNRPSQKTKEKSAISLQQTKHRLEYAPAVAPWTRPTGERDECENSKSDEDHTTPGAFRINR